VGDSIDLSALSCDELHRVLRHGSYLNLRCMLNVSIGCTVYSY